MAKVLYGDTLYECAKAVRGVDYVKLYDENNTLIIAFHEILDFSAFTLQEGSWEKGISTEIVSASAKVVNKNIELNLLTPASLETGLQITFEAPCDYTDAKSVIIEGVSFSLVDALGVSIEAGIQAFVSGAIVAIILDCEDSEAYIQNAAVSPHQHDIRDVKNLQSTLNGKAPKYTYGTADLTAGESELETGKLHFVYV